MTVVRELVTKLSFDVDQKGIQNFNRAILGFKARFAIATTAVSGFVGGFVKAVSAVADTVLDTRDLSRETGIAIDNLVGLEKAAGKFRISPQQFSSAMVKFNNQVQDAKFGFGELERIALQTGISIRKDNGELKDTAEIFLILLDFIGRIEDESLRTFIAKNLFDDGKFANLAKLGRKEIEALVEGFKPLGDQFAKSEQSAERFSQSMFRVTESIKQLGFVVVPPIFELLADIFEGFNIITGQLQEKGAVGGTRSLFRAIRKGVTGFETAVEEDDFLKTKESLQLESENLKRAVLGFNPSRDTVSKETRIDVRNEINVTVPPGTEETQVQFLKDSAEKIIGTAITDEFDKIGNNFPEVE